MVRNFTLSLTLILTLCFGPNDGWSQEIQTNKANDKTIDDPLDPFDMFGFDELSPAGDDSNKSAEELTREASYLLISERPLDARTKLLKAIQKDPNAYKPYYLLAGYYMVHVGHYRLALKYIKRAEELFVKVNGAPPYQYHTQQLEHGNIIYYLSQARLNLDDYKGALEALDRYTSLGYQGEWYAGSRSWILMKLGRIQEAIKVAREGILSGTETGRTLNMLGILLSMNDQPQEALDIFRQAIAFEFSQGSDGQPATPLNNAGEVYKEIFDDEKAESTFLRATSLPDGCEHVFPSLNLALLYIDQFKFDSALKTLDAFQRCIAQFPLRSNEEHAALIHLVRGRIDLHTGNIDRAIKRFEAALQGTQWFGKIGTNQNDLQVAATISLAQALIRKNNSLSFYLSQSLQDWFATQRAIAENSVYAWWLMRRARQMLIEDLNDLEDLTIRNTDSLLEYPTLGEVLSKLPKYPLTRRINAQKSKDSRAIAATFYDAYLAEAAQSSLLSSDSGKEFDLIIERAREGFDALLGVHATLHRMQSLNEDSERYRELAYRVFYLSAPHLRSYGLRLPVYLEPGANMHTYASTIAAGPFRSTQSKGKVCAIAAEAPKSLSGVALRFSCPGRSNKDRLIEGSDITEVVNRLSDAVFREEIKNVGIN